LELLRPKKSKTSLPWALAGQAPASNDTAINDRAKNRVISFLAKKTIWTLNQAIVGGFSQATSV
jgi:hypothetical protein